MSDFSSLSLGSNGAAVQSLQARLGMSQQDGKFGPNTKAAVTNFQKANHIQVDGIAGPQTFSKLPAAVRALHTDSFEPAKAQAPNASSNPQVHVNVPWLSQGTSRPGYTGSFATGCKPTSQEMARRAGVTAVDTGQRNTSPTQMRNYIDSQLNSNKPVVVGVQHPGGNHVVVITGRGVDAKGTYYTFNDPGTGNAATGSDTRALNRFYADKQNNLVRSVDVSGRGVVNQPYRVWYAMQNQ